MEPGLRVKPVHVISTDTLVENPIVARWVEHSLDQINKSANKAKLPLQAHRLTPEIANTFWVNLIGKGYPAPRHKFRWCTERMKISPSNRFIREVVRENGEAILVLGTRKKESSKRAHVMRKYEKQRMRVGLSPNASLPNSFVYSPIEEWSNDDVWQFLMLYENPWGVDNHHLLTMYQGASPDGECPLVLDTSTPSCGDSRFGCWVCTLVDKDKSMHAMIQNDEEKEWMLPLLQLRDRLDNKNDRDLRDFRRMSGAVQLFHDQPIPGPYKQEVREDWLRQVLEAQTWVRKNGPKTVRSIDLITLSELQEIRRIWLLEKHEIEDSLPRIYDEVTGQDFPSEKLDDSQPFGRDEMAILRDVCGEDRLHYEMLRDLLCVERNYSTLVRRSGIYEALTSAVKKSFYEGEEDAVARARQHRDYRSAASNVLDANAEDLDQLLQWVLDDSDTGSGGAD
jgi:DNA sulfur modification protein DndC